MATRKPLVIVGNTLEEIQGGDTIDPSVLPASSAADPAFAYFMA